MPYQDASFQSDHSPVAQIGATHRYAINGDEATIEAEIHLVDPVAAGYLNWTLQLWAGDVLVADARFGALYPDAFGVARVGATVLANLPAGANAHPMILALTGDDGTGPQRFDAFTYPRNERFVLPQIEGAVGYSLAVDHTRISADGIYNPRAADNLSGSLVLELWALASPYQGGAFTGSLIGSEFIGALPGQSRWHDVSAHLPACVLPAGRWHLVLMLREWVGEAYLTRDYRNFELAVDGPLPSLPAAPSPAAKASPAKATTKPAAPAAEPVSAAKRSAKQTGPAHKPSRVSVNTASAGELSFVRGINATVAEGIIAGRPWKKLDDLIAVKGIGAKSLDKLKPLLKI